jgi:hypothetical protein
MKIAQTLRRPANWQDFESLCLLLWREEWRSDDLKKNGRNGQAQHGVDISGHRVGENEYSGIQCKCKPGNNPLTTDEIDEEIENAKAFKPALRRLVFATTADKDAKIEEYVRIKDEVNRNNGLFAIDLKSWQDIIDLLELNKPILNTYLDIVAEDYAVDITFNNGSNEITINPKYSHITYMEPVPKEKKDVMKTPKVDVTKVVLGSVAAQMQYLSEMTEKINAPMQSLRSVRGTIKTNLAYCPLKFQMINQGRSPIDDYKIIFNFNNRQALFKTSNIEKNLRMPEITIGRVVSNIVEDNGWGIRMFGDSLIPGDVVFSDDFFVHLPIGVKEVNIDWRLLSRHYSTDGTLKIIVNEEVESNQVYNRERAGEEEIVDCVIKEELLD